MKGLIISCSSLKLEELLGSIGVVPTQVVVEGSVFPKKLEAPKEFVRRVALERAERAYKRGFYVLGVERTIACGRRILGIPSSEEAAREMLVLLSGRRHRILTSLVLIDPKGSKRYRMESTVVKVKRLSEEEQRGYFKTQQWKDSLGGLNMGGLGGGGILLVRGCYGNLQGLPLAETLSLLRGSGYVVGRQDE